MKSAVVATLAVLALVSIVGARPASPADPATVTTETRSRLLVVEEKLRSRDTSNLTPEQRATRARALDELRRYAIAGVFPHNHSGPARPIFVDEHGTLCAFANLLAFSGRGDFVKRVARTHNDAKVADLAQEPEVVSWSRESGISIAEAATIQMPYYPQTPTENPVAPTASGTTGARP